MKLYFKLILVTFIAISVCVDAKSQHKRKILLELSGKPLITSFKKDNYAASYSVGISHFLSDKFNIGLQFHNIYNFDKKYKIYDAASSLGISTSYVVFKGSENSFWNGGSFEVSAEFGGGSSDFNDGIIFFYGDLSFKVYVENLVFIGIGYNHKRYDKKADIDNSNSLYLSFGFRL